MNARMVVAVLSWAMCTSGVNAQENAGQVMMDAIRMQCLPKIEAGAMIDKAGLQVADPALSRALLPRGDGKVWRTDAPEVVVVDPEVPYACHVVGEDVPHRAFSDALRAWLSEPGNPFAFDGFIPFSPRNQKGLYLAAQTPDGDYIELKIINAPGNRMSALVTRSPDSREARRLLRQ